MDTDQIRAGLTSLYDKGQRIVFWHDPDGEFAEMVPDLDLVDVSVLRLEKTPALEAKVAIELEQPDTRFLIYETGDQPTPDKDWLLDIRLYSEPFAADRSSMILKELGLHQQSLRNHISARSKFFASKERMRKTRPASSRQPSRWKLVPTISWWGVPSPAPTIRALPRRRLPMRSPAPRSRAQQDVQRSGGRLSTHRHRWRFALGATYRLGSLAPRIVARRAIWP